MMPKPHKVALSSPNLFHFTTKIDYLASILKNGFEHRPMNEDLPFTGYTGSVWSIPGIVRHQFTFLGICFCDIPEYAIRDHSNQYGQYGICLKKNWGMEKGVTPIRYIHHSTPDFSNDTFYTIKDSVADLPRYKGSFVSMIAHMLQQSQGIPLPTEDDWAKVPETIQRYFQQIDAEMPSILNHTRRYLGLARSYEGEWTDRVTGKTGKRTFYDEKEWRSLKTSRKQGNLTFEDDDVVAILVSSKKEKSELIKAMGVELKVSPDKITTLKDFLEKSDDALPSKGFSKTKLGKGPRRPSTKPKRRSK